MEHKTNHSKEKIVSPLQICFQSLSKCFLLLVFFSNINGIVGAHS